jgi:hypothetical protein
MQIISTGDEATTRLAIVGGTQPGNDVLTAGAET